jgi:hypothetical protein
MAIQVLEEVIGGSIVFAEAWSVLGTLVVPRRVRSRIARVVFLINRSVFRSIADRYDAYERKDRILAFQAPIQIVAQVVVWLGLYELGFGLLIWPFARGSGLGSAME